MGMEPIKPKNPLPTPPVNNNGPAMPPQPGDNAAGPVQGQPLSAPPNQHTSAIMPDQQKYRSEIKNSPGGWLSQLKGFASFVAFIGGVLLAAFLINQFVFQSYFVEGTSMVPTLHNNDRLIIEKVGKTASAIQGKPYIPERGDIVVLDSSIVDATGAHEQLIKRVIGLPHETVRIDDGKVIVINAQEPEGFDVDERLGLDLEQTYSPGPQVFMVPEGSVFVMGDNRTQNGSHDSRAFGPVSADKLEGRLWARILPIDQARVFP